MSLPPFEVSDADIGGRQSTVRCATMHLESLEFQISKSTDKHKKYK